MFKKLGLALVAAAVMGVGTAQALPIAFTKIPNQYATDVSSQLGADLQDNGNGTVTFKFTNNVGTASSITDIYFDDRVPVLVVPISVSALSVSGAGVSFDTNPTPAQLPGGGNAWNTSAGADSNNPITANGINLASEWLGITFTLVNNKSFNDVVGALASQNLSIGLHVQAIAGGDSDSYLNSTQVCTPPKVYDPDTKTCIQRSTVPEPTSMLLLGAGLVGLASRMRRR